MIIGLTGFKGSGKDTFAKPFIEAGWTQLRFADPLKAMLRAMLNVAGKDSLTTDFMLEGHLKEEPHYLLGGKTPRHAMQTLGTEWRNMLHPELWTRIMYGRLQNTPGNISITDVRFPHEVKLLKDWGATLIRVSRAGCHETGHESERYIKNLPVDIVIRNNKGIAELHAEAKRLLATFDP